MKKDWEIKELGEVCDFVQGIQRGVKLQGEIKKNNQVRFLRIVDYTQGNELPRYIDFPGERYILNKTDVSIVRYGASTGFVCRGLEGALANNLFRVIPKSNIKLANDFLFNYLNSPIFQNIIKESMNGAAMPAISFGLIMDILIPIPSLPEQKRIVSILDKAFSAIERSRNNAEQNLKNAKELFESYLQGVFDPSTRSRQGRDDWVEKILKDVVTDRCNLSYGIVQPGNDFENGLAVVRPIDLKNKFVNKDNVKLINPINAEKYKRTTLQGNELLLCVRGDTGVIALVTDDFNGANVTRGIVPISFDNNVLSLQFGYYSFISPFIQKQIKDKTYGAALMQINIRDVRQILMILPPVNEQRQIVQKLDKLSAETKKLENIYQQKLEELEELKKSILQKAFNGEL